MSGCKRGFTLAELMIVIAIVYILVAILFPVFGTAREQARKTSCLSNCKQIGMAMQMYAQDYDEKLPGWDNPQAHPLAHQWNWAIIVPLLSDYVRSDQIWTCPSAPKTLSFARGPEGKEIYVHYGYNEYLYNTRHVVPPYYAGKWNSLAALEGTKAGVANIAIVADSAAAGVFNDWGTFDGIQIKGDPPGFGIHRIKYANGLFPPSPRHSDAGANIVFADGHVRFVPGSKMVGSYGTGQKAETGGLVEWPVVNPLNIPPP
jgi:prepilin-type N-terminal cleavage/methylation domain-containing protein/prepilin-type processing-associated H-X9-DG protein